MFQASSESNGNFLPSFGYMTYKVVYWIIVVIQKVYIELYEFVIKLVLKVDVTLLNEFKLNSVRWIVVVQSILVFELVEWSIMVTANSV